MKDRRRRSSSTLVILCQLRTILCPFFFVRKEAISPFHCLSSMFQLFTERLLLLYKSVVECCCYYYPAMAIVLVTVMADDIYGGDGGCAYFCVTFQSISILCSQWRMTFVNVRHFCFPFESLMVWRVRCMCLALWN